MRTAALVVALALAALGQTRPEPKELPPGQFCQHVSARTPRPAHPCTCQRHCMPSEDEQGHQTEVVVEDAKCTQFCHKDKCACPATGCE